MAKKSGSWWPWLIGGAAVAGIGAWALKAHSYSPPPPSFWVRHGYYSGEAMPPAALAEVRRDVQKLLAQKSVTKLNDKYITHDTAGLRNHLVVDIKSLSTDDQKKVFDIDWWTNLRQYGIQGYCITGTNHTERYN